MGKVQVLASYPPNVRDGCIDYILRGIEIELWSKVKAKATLERKTVREVIFEDLKWYLTPVEIPASSDKKKKGKRRIEKKKVAPFIHGQE